MYIVVVCIFVFKWPVCAVAGVAGETHYLFSVMFFEKQSRRKPCSDGSA